MRKVAFIACSAKKLKRAAQAKDLYQGSRFKSSCAWTRRNHMDECFVISGRHHLVSMHEILEPYDESLESKCTEDRNIWAYRIHEQFLIEVTRPSKIIVLADDLYAEPLKRFFLKADFPLAGLSEREQIAWLNN